MIRQEIQRQINLLNSPYVVLAIPLLLEKQWQHQLDRVLVVDCSEAQQRVRANERDGGSKETIKQIISSQVSRQERTSAADDLINNSGSLISLRTQIERLHSHYLALAANN